MQAVSPNARCDLHEAGAREELRSRADEISRRDGDTALFDVGVSQEKRQLLGIWKAVEVELAFIGFLATRHLQWAPTTAV